VATYAQRQGVGRFGERLAVTHLLDQGYAVLERNYRCRWGEIDVVARDGTTLVVCEVKTRRGVGWGTPLESVTAAKAQRLRTLAEHWVRERGVSPGDVRVDVIGVLLEGRDRPLIEHLRGVA